MPGHRSGQGYVMGHTTFSKRTEYEAWKNKVIRFLSLEYAGDRCTDDFEKAIEFFESKFLSTSNFDKLLGVLEGCKILPTKVKVDVKSRANNSPNINFINQNSQHQTQEQSQSIAIEIFVDAIKDELTGKQVKEIKEIITDEPDVKKAKVKLLDKIKSFGSDVASNVLANILTNPTIWGNL